MGADVSSCHGDVGGRRAPSEDALPHGPQRVRVFCHSSSTSPHNRELIKTRDGYLFFFCFRVKEEVFWRNYFYRVSLIKQSAQLTALAAQQTAERQKMQKTGANLEAVHQRG